MNPRIIHVLSGESPGALAQARLIADSTNSAIGSEKSAIIAALGQRPKDQSLLSFHGHEDAVTETVRIRGTFDVAAWRKMRRLFNGDSRTIVHLWDPQFLPTLAFAATIVRPRWQVVVTFRHPPGGQAAKWKSRLLRRNASRFVAESDALRANCQKFGCGGNALQVIQGGISHPPGSHSVTHAEHAEHYPAHIGIAAQSRLIVAIGPLSAHKRIADLIWAVDMLAPLEPRLRLAIVGDGSARDQLDDVRRSVRRSERIDFYPSHALPEILAQSELVGLPGCEDGCSYAALEAMSAGLPLVAARGGNNQELLGESLLASTGQNEPTETEAGLTFPAGDRGQLARTLWLLLEQDELRVALGAAARQRAATAFPAEKMASAYLDLYRGLLDRHLK